MTYFMENMKFIQSKSKLLEKSITTEEPLFSFEIEPTADGSHNYVLENDISRCFIHSIYNIPREMQIIFKDVDPDTEVLILFGFGCGYALDYIGEMFPRVEHVIIIEPIVQLFREVLEKVLLKDLIEKVRQMTLILNRDIEETVAAVGQAIVKEHGKKIDLVYHLSYRSLLKGYYESFNTSFIRYLQQRREGIVHRDILKERWPSSLFANLQVETLPVEEVFSHLTEYRVVLLTGGPYLKERLDMVQELKERALIIALGDAIFLLEENGIEPHLRFLPHKGSTTTLFDFNEEESIPLIYSDHITSQLLSSYQGLRLKMILKSDVLGQYIYNQGGLNFYPVREGPSLINSLVDLLCQSNVKEIFFMDLQLSPEEESAPREDHSTTGYLLHIKRVLEEQILANPHVQFSIDGERTVDIQHFVSKTCVDFLHELDDKDPHLTLQEVLGESPLLISSYKEKIEKGLTKVEEELEAILALTKKWIKDLKKLSRYQERNIGVHRLLKEYRYLEHHWNNLKEHTFYSQVMMKMLGDTLMSIFSATDYKGEDKRRQVMALENRQRGIVAETEGYVLFLQSLIEEYREEDVDLSLFDD